MSSEFCSLCGPKRSSRALCNCCEQYLCRDHLKEHDDLLTHQLEPLTDQINQLIYRLEHFNLNSFVRPIHEELNTWRQNALESIEKFHREKCEEIDRFYSGELDQLRRQTKQMQNEMIEIIRNEDVTKKHLDHLKKSIEQLERETNRFGTKSIDLNLRPIIIEENSAKTNEDQQVKLTSSIQSIFLPSNEVFSITCNDHSILVHQYPRLLTYDYNLILLHEQDLSHLTSVRDLCWSSVLNRFLILTDIHLFLFDHESMILEPSNIAVRTEGHWHNLTCSNQSLFLTAYRWGTHLYQYHFRELRIEYHRRLQISPSKDESIDHLLVNQTDQLAILIRNRIRNEKRLELRSEQTFHCLWTKHLHLSLMTVDPTYLCSFNENQLIIIDSNQSQLIFIHFEGLTEQILHYESAQPQRALQLKQNFLLVATRRSLHLHQLF